MKDAHVLSIIIRGFQVATFSTHPPPGLLIAFSFTHFLSIGPFKSSKFHFE